MLRSSNGDSCRLWLQAPQRPSDSLTAQLAAQVEAAKEQVQQYAQAADAAALTAQCAVTEAAQQVGEQFLCLFVAFVWAVFQVAADGQGPLRCHNVAL